MPSNEEEEKEDERKESTPITREGTTNPLFRRRFTSRVARYQLYVQFFVFDTRDV